VGFSDKLRLLNLLMDDIRAYREVPIKLCREVRFSHGGQYFAAVNGNIIMVFDFYTCEKVVDLRGHNSKVKSVHWGADDTTIVSCGLDGAVYQWDWEDCKRLSEYVQKGTHYHCALGNAESVFAVGSDQMMKELELPELQARITTRQIRSHEQRPI
jgi:WD40 repeat protein